MVDKNNVVPGGKVREISDIDIDIDDDTLYRENMRIDMLLCKANALTSFLVDYIHGYDSDNNAFHVDFFGRLIKETKATLKKLNDTLKGEEKYHIWHNICRMRRIFSRIYLAVNPQYISNDDSNSKLKIMHDISNVRAELISCIKKESFKIAHIIRKKERVDWTDVAIVYESAMLLRKNELAGALSLSRLVYYKAKFSKDSFIPKKVTTGIVGLVPFNPGIFTLSEGNKKSELLDEEMKRLFELSINISLLSENAASQGVVDYENYDLQDIHVLLDICRNFVSKNIENLALSSILHLESTLRVLTHNAAFSSDNSADELCKKHVEYVEYLKQAIENKHYSGNYDKSIRDLILSKINQDTGILLSNILPTKYLHEVPKQVEKTEAELNQKLDEVMGKMSKLDDTDGSIQQKIIEMAISAQDIRNDLKELTINNPKVRFESYLKQGWPTKKDWPIHHRFEFYKEIKSKLIYRSKNLGGSLDLHNKSFGNIGDPNKANPLYQKGTPEFLFSDSSESKHLRFFPQSSINQAQLSLSLAYLNCLSSNPDQEGMFGSLNDTVEKTFKNYAKRKSGLGKNKTRLKISSDVKGRLQFTIGQGVGQSSKPPLTRVNKMDAMMYLGSALNRLDALLKEQLKNFRPEVIFDNSARLCSSDVNDFIIEDEHKLHIHEILNATEDLHQSPMRFSRDYVDVKEGKERIIETLDRILRASFCRLNLLSTKAEQLTHILLQKPLRQPFMSSSIIIIDQVRILLHYLHTDWLRAAKEFYDNTEHKTLISQPTISVDKVNYLNQYMGRSKPFFRSRKVQKDRKFKLKDNSKVGNIPTEKNRRDFSDVAVEYILSNSPSVEQMLTKMVKNKINLHYERYIGDVWTELLDESIKIKLRLTGHFTDQDEQKSIIDNLKINLNQFGDDKPLRLDYPDKEIVEAFEILKENSQYEWLLWARLAFLPAAFDGRIIVSSTTFKDINASDGMLKKYSPQDEVKSLVWGEVKKTYEQYWKSD